MKKLLNRKGFTIIEVLTTVVIIMVLVAVAAPLYRGVQEQAKETAFDATVRSLRQAGEMHLLSGGGDVIWSAEGGQAAGIATANHESWMEFFEEWPANSLDTGDFVVEIQGGRVSVSPGRE